MTKRVLTAVLALVVAIGAACSGDKEIDKEGSVEQLVEAGLSQEQAECVVDRVDAEFGDDQEALDVILSDDSQISDLDDDDEARFTEIMTTCAGAGEGTTDTTAGGTTETTAGG